jgi:cell division protein ZapE
VKPLDRYLKDIESGLFSPDDAQASVVEKLNKIYLQLTGEPESEPKSFLGRLKHRVKSAEQPNIQGLYLWGGVGRGKTWLVDLFFDSLPFEEKQRIHFHRFMQFVHAELRTLHNEVDPLKIVAERLSKKVRVLCFDEFFVSDITDAMLLGRLMTELFDRGIVLIATSNIEPDGLYKNGLQRERFLPAIEQIKLNCDVMMLDSDTDYRLRELEQAEIYHHPLDQEANRILVDLFNQMATSEIIDREVIEIENRQLQTEKCTDGIVWFDFKNLCDVPRAPADYIELSKYFHTIFIGNIFYMDEMKNNFAMRFINLIDELYDRNVKVVISAESEPEELYSGKRLQFQFERTISRLQEMRSHEYLEQPHLP